MTGTKVESRYRSIYAKPQP